MYCSAYAIGPWAHLEGTEAAAACSEAQMFECSLNLFLSMLLTLPTLAYPSVYIQRLGMDSIHIVDLTRFTYESDKKTFH